MKKAEALRISIDIVETYLELKGHYDVTNSILLVYYHTPSVEKISEFSDYILENEDKSLYNKTYGLIDLSFIDKILNRLHTCWFEIGENDREDYINGNYDRLRDRGKFEGINNLAIAYNYWEKITEENNVIKAVFKNLIPPQEQAPITDSVIDTSTGLTPEWWEKYPELDTTEARLYVSRAIERGFIQQTSTGFKWIRAKREGEGDNTLMALFWGMIYCGDKIMPSRYGDKWKLGNGGIFPDSKLKKLMGVNTLGTIRTNNLDSSRCKTAPRGWEDIVSLFEE